MILGGALIVFMAFLAALALRDKEWLDASLFAVAALQIASVLAWGFTIVSGALTTYLLFLFFIKAAEKARRAFSEEDWVFMMTWGVWGASCLAMSSYMAHHTGLALGDLLYPSGVFLLST